MVRDKPDDPPATYLIRQSAKACMMGSRKNAYIAPIITMGAFISLCGKRHKEET